MAAYAQAGAKRQKVRERVDNVDYFQGIEKIEFNSSAGPTDSGVYRHYNAGERLHSKTIEEWLKISVSLTHFRLNGLEPNNRHQPTPHRPWDDGTNSLDNHKRCLKAFFDLMSKLGIKYWTAFDTDLVPYADSYEECKNQWDEMVEYVQECHQRFHVKLLWLAPDLHSHVRYTAGALTNPDASTFVQAAAQTKKCLEVAQRLHAESFLLWPCREGYQAVFRADVARELKLFAKLLKMTAEYKERLNYRCQLLIMPYYKNVAQNNNNNNVWKWQEGGDDVIHTYMWDVTSCLYLLKTHNLERYYKVCCWPGHHMFMANAYNMLGGVMISKDTKYCFDSKRLTMTMKCIIDQGSAPTAGINLQLSPRRDCDLRDTVTSYVRHIDVIARALRVACNITAEQVFVKYTQQRYGSYYSGFGSRLLTGDVSLEECEEHYKKNQNNEVVSDKGEHYELVFQRYVDSCDNI